MRRLFDRIPLVWKYLMMSVFIVMTFFGSFYLFSNRLILALNDMFNLNVTMALFQADFFWFLASGSIIIVIILLIIYFDLRYFLARLNPKFS